MVGTASDYQSGMVGGRATVRWSLSSRGAQTPARAFADDDFGSWRADIALIGFGAHTLYVWATDRAGNTMPDPVSVPVLVIRSYVPVTLEEQLSDQAYLRALLSFAAQRIRLTASSDATLDTATLTAVVGQPLEELARPFALTHDPGDVNALRIPVELLRARVAATRSPTSPAASGEISYRANSLRVVTGVGGDVVPAARAGPSVAPPGRNGQGWRPSSASG